MMRWLALVMLCVLLAGCGVQPQEETFPSDTTSTSTTAATAPTEPTGCYDPGSAVEQGTGGAVKAYPLGIPDVYGFLCMDGNAVVFSGTDTTCLTRLSGDNFFTTASVQLSTRLLPEDPSVRVSEQGMTYYDSSTSEMVILDIALKEVRRIQLPEELVGSPVMTEDREYIYYCTPDALRVLEMETGIHKLLAEMSYESQNVVGILQGGALLECEIIHDDGQPVKLFLSSENGELMAEYKTRLELHTWDERYYAVHPNEKVTDYIFGDAAEQKILYPVEGAERVLFLPENHSAVSFTRTNTGITADWYDLESGMRKSTLNLGFGEIPGQVRFDSVTEDVLFLRRDDTYGCETLYRWTVKDLPSGDEAVYTAPYYTYEKPDEAGLAQCRKLAQELGKKHGVEILIWQDATAVQPWDYGFEAEFRVPLIQNCLERLDGLLSAYPAGMLEQAVSGTTEGKFAICLVGQITGTPESGNLNEEMGIQFWQEEDAYVVLSTESDLNYQVYHEIFHVLETRIFSKCTAFYEWEKWNPEGFAYDYDYALNADREPGEYLSGDDRAFIDTFSMSFPIEDRARIAEFAMNPENELYFTSETMQNKLRAICTGIRQAFDLEETEEKFLWEQYLRTS